MQNSRTIFVFHVLRNYAPSNLNRDEDGGPKYAFFGGVQRGRISSQSLKRSVRLSEPFDVFRDDGLIDIRTRYLPLLMKEALENRGVDNAAIADIVGKLQELGKSEKKATTDSAGEEQGKKGKELKPFATKQLIRCAPTTIAALCDQLLALRASDSWKLNLEKVIRPIDVYGVDTALFGSMTTSAAFSNVNSACQVSHAISVNRSAYGKDFFTAVDDYDGESAMVGGGKDALQFTSNCYYWTVAVSVPLLLNNLQGEVDMVKCVMQSLIESLFVAHPSGKQTTFFSMPAASLVIAEKRRTAMDYANAFEDPVSPIEGKSLVRNAIDTLAAYISKVDVVYAQAVERRHVGLFDVEIPQSEQLASWENVAQWVTNNL